MSVIIRITRAERATIKKTTKIIIKIVKVPVKPKKTIIKRTISKRKTAEIKVVDKDNNDSDKIKKSEIVYIRKQI
jgi:hypothetical protein